MLGQMRFIVCNGKWVEQEPDHAHGVDELARLLDTYHARDPRWAETSFAVVDPQSGERWIVDGYELAALSRSLRFPRA